MNITTFDQDLWKFSQEDILSFPNLQFELLSSIKK